MMDTYLTIMVTVLVATQVLRITQNRINLHLMKERTLDDENVVAMWDKLVNSIDQLSEILERERE